MSESNFTTKLVKISLYSLGIFKNHTYSKAYFIIFIVSTSISVLGSIVGFFTSTGQTEKLEATFAIVPQITSVLMFIDLYASQDNLLALLATVKGDGEYTHDVINRTDALVKKKFVLFFALQFILATCFILPSLWFFTHDSIITAKDSLVIPFWFSCGDDNLNNKIFKYFCWNVNSKSELLVTNMVQCVITGSLYIVNCTAFALYSIITAELTLHMDSFSSKVAHSFITAAPLITTEKEYDRCPHRVIEQDRKTYQDFLKIIKYQQYLRKCFIQTAQTWKGYVTWFYMDFYFGLTTSLFMAFMEHEDAKSLALKGLILCITGSFIATVNAYFAQIISDSNENIFEEMNKIPWYTKNIQFRKIYAIVLTLNRRPIHVKIAQIYEINLHSFGILLKTAYSLLNVLLLKYSNK